MYHDHRRRIGVSNRMDNTIDKKFLNNLINFFFGGKGMTIRTNIGRKVVEDEGNGIIMKTMGRRKSLGSGKKT